MDTISVRMLGQQNGGRILSGIRRSAYLLKTSLLLVVAFLAPYAAAQLTAVPPSLSFGNTYVNVQSSSKGTTLTNTGAASLTITAITSSCPEYKLASGLVPITLAPGKSERYSMYFLPDALQAFNCQYTAAVQGGTSLNIPMTGTGIAANATVTVNATALSFPNQNVGTTSATQSVTITNTGTNGVQLKSISVAPAAFATSPVNLPLTISKNSSTTITVSYSPDFAINHTGVLGLSFNSVPPIVIDLSANGVAPSSLAITNVPTLPQPTIGAAYQAQLWGSAGTPPYTFALAAGSSLPSGLSLSGAGLISGTVASTVAKGAYSFTATATDSAGSQVSEVFTLNPAPATGAACNNISFNVTGTSTPIVALNDLGTGTYQGYEGGLYPGGSNVRPLNHDLDGFVFAQGIVPLNSSGVYDPNGKYVLLGLGESTTLDEFGAFIPLAKYDPQTNSHLVIVNGAQGGATPSLFAVLSSSDWTTILQNYLPDQGVTAQQVVAAWIEDTNAITSGTFPKDISNMQGSYETMMNNLLTLFPNIKLVYFSSRIYGGYSNGVAKIDPEPYAYEAGFAVKNVIADQLNGKPSLNYNAALGPVEAPWMAWGPYYWADGLLARSDGGVWTCPDMQKDGTHPASPAGDLKVAGQLINFFKNDDTTESWFLQPSGRGR
jgi:hypothetical protein